MRLAVLLQQKKAMVLATIVNSPTALSVASPVAIGTRAATRASEAISSSTADVIMPVAAGERLRPSVLSETIVNETAVAIMARPHISAILGVSPKAVSQCVGD